MIRLVFDYIKNLLVNNIDTLTLVVAILLAIVGWIVALILQNSNIKVQTKARIKYDIYKQLVELHKEAQDSIARLYASVTPPFILMESYMISFQVKLKSEQEAVLKGGQKWSEFVQVALENHSELSDKYISMQYVLEDWMAPIKSLVKPKDVLMAEVDKLKQRIRKNLMEFLTYSVNHGYDWRRWDRDEIEKISESIKEDTITIMTYLSDFMVLVHNELLAGYFKYKRPTRRTLDSKYKVLTKDGLVVNLESDKN